MDSVLIITPYKTKNDLNSIGFSWIYPSLELAYVAAFLSKNGYNIRFLDLSFNVLTKLICVIKESQPLAVIISATTEEMNGTIQTLNFIKMKFPHIKTILEGPHATGIPKETLEEINSLDYIIIGEPEETALELMNIISRKNLSDDILKVTLGLAYRNEENNIVINNTRPRIKEIDEIPFPAWHLFDLSYYNSILNDKAKNNRELLVRTSRGCPYNCIFCQSCFRIRGPVIFRKIDAVILEIEYIIERFNITNIVFIDDTFTLNRTRILTLCNEMIARGYHQKIKWVCSTRVDMVDEELLIVMKKAGCKRIIYGIESGNEEILKLIKKEIDLTRVEQSIQLTKKIGIETHCGIIYGHPKETKQTLKDSLNIALKTDPDIMVFGLVTPYPGSEMYNLAQENKYGLKLIANDWSDYNKQSGRTIELSNLSFSYIKLWQFYSYLRFYLRKRKIINIFKVVNIKAIPNYLLGVIQSLFKI